MTAIIINGLSKSTLIRMWNGSTKLITDVQAGDIAVGLFNYEEDYIGDLIPAAVTNVFNYGVHPIRCVPLSDDGISFIYLNATPNQSFLARYCAYWDDPFDSDYNMLDIVDNLIDSSYLGVPVYQWVDRRFDSETTDNFVKPADISRKPKRVRADTYKIRYDNLKDNQSIKDTIDEFVYSIEVDSPDKLFLLANGIFCTSSDSWMK